MDLTQPIIFHTYDHCPYCIRVKLVLGWSSIRNRSNFKQLSYRYTDQAVCNINPTGKKILPVLEYYKIGESTPTYLNESGNIIDLILESTGYNLQKSNTEYEQLIARWLGEMHYGKVSRPLFHVVGSFGLKDFAEQADVDYARQKYIGQGFDYHEAEQKAEEIANEFNTHLELLEHFIKDDPSKRSYDDIILGPVLIILTASDRIVLPHKDYVNHLRNETGVPSF